MHSGLQFALTVLKTAKLASCGTGVAKARRPTSAGPGMAGAHADLPELRRIDAIEPDLDARDANAIAVDHLRGTDDVRDVPVRDQAGRGKAGQPQAGKQRRAGAAVHPKHHPLSPAAM